MDSVPVNWEALDSLIIDFVKSENLIEDSLSPPASPSSSSSSSSSSSYQSRLLIRQIRRSVECGDIDAAIDLLRVHARFLLDDHRLLFCLQKQRFIELLRKRTAEDRESAINCLRESLAPCALDAYPEAYEEFKHILLALVYDEDDKNSPVANEWSPKRRIDITGLLSSVLRAHLCAYDPLFAMSLSIHKLFCFRQGVPSPISDLTQRLLLEDRDPPATPLESFYEAPPFDEVDIQALAHAVELTRQGAIDSLRFAKGDLYQAFQNELCRIRLDDPMFDELVHEYCVYRGFIEFSVVDSPGMQLDSGSINNDQSECEHLSKNCSTEVGYGDTKLSGSGTSATQVIMEGSPESNTNLVSIQSTDTEERYPSETSHGDCSTSWNPQFEKVLQKNKCLRVGETNKRKRWRGRHEKEEFVSGPNNERSREELNSSSSSSVASTIVLKDQQVSPKSCFPNMMKNREDKYELVLGLQELASRGMAVEVVEEINEMDPNFFVQNPALLFQLKQVEFLKLVGSGNHTQALRVACSFLGPLASSHPDLLKPLKETLLALLKPNEEAFNERLPLCALANSLQVAIGRRFGIEEPQLMKIIRATLYTHSEWFKLQMCKDRFEGLLRIDALKEFGGNLIIDAASKLDVDMSADGSSQVTGSSNNRKQEDRSPTQSSARDVGCDESAILKVMEFLALPRADAIHLLAQYNGNAETVIQQIFA
ncbi:uncharacterized protein LOC107764759 isoform X2 [Nicotiana tabacum]|uniref:Uncharacterized protein LOC107764759 isoform X2 n=1 Tax=Nicotiana tabacum TaxID=4097 RepID=A0AC58T055_TOBAC